MAARLVRQFRPYPENDGFCGQSHLVNGFEVSHRWEYSELNAWCGTKIPSDFADVLEDRSSRSPAIASMLCKRCFIGLKVTR